MSAPRRRGQPGRAGGRGGRARKGGPAREARAQPARRTRAQPARRTRAQPARRTRAQPARPSRGRPPSRRAGPGGSSSSTSARRARGRRPSRRPRVRSRVLRHLLQGDRLYVLALVAVVTVVGAMAMGPLEAFTAAADRVEGLERTRDQLSVEVDALEQRRERLKDPEALELLARSELGLVKPGEIPFVVVSPDEDPEQLVPEPAEPDRSEEPWYRRLGRLVTELFDAES